MHNYRVSRSGGGVGLYLADNLNFKVRTDLTFSDEWAESLFVEISQTKRKNIIVGTVYRPPDKNLREFLNDLDRLLDIVSKENKTVFLMGDWNLNIMNSIHNLTSLFLDLLYSRMFFLFITRPTRITSHKASLIDNIFSNDPCSQSFLEMN